MITYSTNWMGPVTLRWYKERGFIDEATGEITQRCCGGRIDIRGLPEEEYWNGWHEYSLPFMTETSWVSFSTWLESFKTETLISFAGLMKAYTEETGNEIEYIL